MFVQEQSIGREINDLREKLQSVVADSQRTLQQRDSELETLSTKVKNDATHHHNNGIPSYRAVGSLFHLVRRKSAFSGMGTGM